MPDSLFEPGRRVLSPDALFAELADGQVVITANARLSRTLAGRYSHWRMSRGERQWRSPSLYSWEAFIEQLWQLAGLNGALGGNTAVPGEQQVLALWTSVVQSDPEAHRLLRPESLARDLRDSRRLVENWHIDRGNAAWRRDGNENHELFLRCLAAFEKRCQDESWTPPEDRTNQLAKAADSAWLPHRQLNLLGFDEFTPAQAGLLQAMDQQGCLAQWLQFESRAGQATLWRSAGENDQYEAMARWVREKHEQDAEALIAIVVPDLESRADEIERQLGAVLTPGESGMARPWNVSMGSRLTAWPMIRSALDLLTLLLDWRVDIREMGRVMRSGWIDGASEERGKRALLEKCLRENYQRQIKLGEVMYRASERVEKDADGNELPPDLQEPRPWASPKFARIINRLMSFRREHHAARPPSEWANAFDGLLRRLGWPAGEAGHFDDDVAWQLHESWQNCLRELASLDPVTPRLSRDAAIARMKSICNDTVFQAASPPQNIQVLGLYEASGLIFDHLWVLGLHNDNWPPSARPNPFISLALQREAGIPHSSPARELAVAQTVTQRLLDSSPDVVFSWPLRIDGEETLPSPLLPGQEQQATSPPTGWDGKLWVQSLTGSGPTESIALETPPPLSAEKARGGSNLLKHQSLCPFRAFANHRLGAESLESPVDGISPLLHGTLMHKVLEKFWQQVIHQEALLAMSDEQLAAKLRENVTAVIGEDRSMRNRPEFADVEADRLFRLAWQYLQLEKQREPFEVIGFEREVHVGVEGHSIRLFIDRIDRLETGGDVIIDYKTGDKQPTEWFGERPGDPQLPLYAISAEETPAGVAFAVIRDGTIAFKGIVNGEDVLPGLPHKSSRNGMDYREAGENMSETVKAWRATLHRLMADFLAGDADIDPVDGTKTCNNSWCELQPLCRIGELTGRGDRA